MYPDSAHSPPELSQRFAQLGVVETWVLIAQPSPCRLGPDHECVHGPLHVGLPLVHPGETKKARDCVSDPCQTEAATKGTEREREREAKTRTMLWWFWLLPLLHSDTQSLFRRDRERPASFQHEKGHISHSHTHRSTWGIFFIAGNDSHE